MSTLGSGTPSKGSAGAGSRGSASKHATPKARAIESLVCFVIAGRSYALDVALIREVVPVGIVFPVPSTPAPVLGVFSLRGATVALVDTPRLLGLTATEDPTTALIIARNHQTICGMTIDRVLGVTRFVADHFIAADTEREPPEVIGFMPDERGGLLTVLQSSVIIGALNQLRFR